jgi:hypothetical protein
LKVCLSCDILISLLCLVFANSWRSLKDQSSNLQPYKKMIYSERSWKIEHFLFLRHVLNRCSFRDNCVWNFEFVYKLFVVIHKLFWILCGKIDFYIIFLNFHKINIVDIFLVKWDEQNDTKMIQFEHCFGLLKRKSWFMFSFQ